MSNESSASETTPLRRPDDKINNHINSPQQATSSSSLAFNNYRTLTLNSNITSLVTDPTISLATTTVAIANLNNNSIEVHLNHPRHQRRNSSYNNNNNNNNYNESSTSGGGGASEVLFIKMETNKRILYRVGLDVLILLCGKFKATTIQTII